ncbi:hypothetical protein [Photobacterium alginatilyticum]|uniref:Lipoprotein n=1 Tax=Photobacterium alginatilyticum TaxID=1775171 RepID=A0ABW9YCD7_9GAMM|nr:hypothetical protein [Photobacterium alginatilyticum]NBI51223.1 hypothetical protein [Photobacterium alginatilyticum]
MNMFRYCLISSVLLLTACSWVGGDSDPPELLASDLARIQMRSVEQHSWQIGDIEAGRLPNQSIDGGAQAQVDDDCHSDTPVQLTVGSGWIIEPIGTRLCEYDPDSTEHLASIDSL